MDDSILLGFEGGSNCNKKRRRCKRNLSVDELKQLIKLVKTDGMSHRDAAICMNVKPGLVTRLIRDEKLAKTGFEKIE